MLTSSNDDPALVAKQLNTKQGCISLGAMMGQYKIVDNVLVAVMKKSVPEKKKTANLGRRGRARRDEYVFEVPEQVNIQRNNIMILCQEKRKHPAFLTPFMNLTLKIHFRISTWSFRFVAHIGTPCR